nr:MAG TPA: hypothetical protein [Caudoviricetes sp.]
MYSIALPPNFLAASFAIPQAFVISSFFMVLTPFLYLTCILYVIYDSLSTLFDKEI